MEFSSPFPLLVKFTKGLRSAPATREDVESVAKYLGIVLSHGTLEEHVESLKNELSNQNGFLTRYREADNVRASIEHSKSMFIREIVEHKRPCE